jgi:5-formyltetrahydrofolate cyclo-ligase
LGLVRPNANLERAAIPPDEALIPPDGLDSFGGLDPPGPPDSLGLLGPEALAACRLVLAPALAVDRTGTRLGQGGGWYDRALAFAAPGALILAVCFDWEVWPADALPREPHDRPVDGVLSSQGVELFNRA